MQRLQTHQETNSTKTTQMPDFEVFLILTPMAGDGAAPPKARAFTCMRFARAHKNMTMQLFTAKNIRSYCYRKAPLACHILCACKAHARAMPCFWGRAPSPAIGLKIRNIQNRAFVWFL